MWYISLLEVIPSNKCLPQGERSMLTTLIWSIQREKYNLHIYSFCMSKHPDLEYPPTNSFTLFKLGGTETHSKAFMSNWVELNSCTSILPYAGTGYIVTCQDTRVWPINPSRHADQPTWSCKQHVHVWSGWWYVIVVSVTHCCLDQVGGLYVAYRFVVCRLCGCCRYRSLFGGQQKCHATTTSLTMKQF